MHAKVMQHFHQACLHIKGVFEKSKQVRYYIYFQMISIIYLFLEDYNNIYDVHKAYLFFTILF